MRPPSAFLVFSGFNNRAVVAFCRAARRHGIPFHIISRHGDDPIKSTSYSEKIVWNRSNDELDESTVAKAVESARRRAGDVPLVYAPTTEYLNRFLLGHRDFCRDAELEIGMVQSELYEQISDKDVFYQLCKREGLPIPSQCDEARGVGFPCVAKPRRYFAVDGRVNPKPSILRSELDLHQSPSGAEFVFQEFINGPSYYLLFYFSRDGRVTSSSQKNLIQQPGGGSIVAATSSQLHQTEVAARYTKLFQKLGYRGFVMVELREKNGLYYMIEANPRMWGPLQLTVDAGTGILEAFAEDYGWEHLSVQPTEPAEAGRYFWRGGWEQALQSGRECDFIDFSREEFERDLPLWLESDVWARPDSIAVYENELGSNQ
jgi:predicted ATP-grasp superfamily ATP-dependent carboligase